MKSKLFLWTRVGRRLPHFELQAFKPRECTVASTLKKPGLKKLFSQRSLHHLVRTVSITSQPQHRAQGRPRNTGSTRAIDSYALSLLDRRANALLQHSGRVVLAIKGSAIWGEDPKEEEKKARSWELGQIRILEGKYAFQRANPDSRGQIWILEGKSGFHSTLTFQSWPTKTEDSESNSEAERGGE